MKSSTERLRDELERVHQGGAKKYHDKNASEGKLFARERVRLLLDADSFVEDGALANNQAPELPADGLVCGLGKIHGRPVAVIANDQTVKAGSWGELTVEKIVRTQELAGRFGIPLFYLVDSAGARITDQIRMFPGRRHAGRIFHNEVQLSGYVPQICLLFGPSAAGGAYIPAFCDIVIMVRNNAAMYLGSPRMAEMVIGERASLNDMGGARMHCEISGCGDILVDDDQAAIDTARRYLGYFPQNYAELLPPAVSRDPSPKARPIDDIVPQHQNQIFDMRLLIEALVDEDSWFEIKKLYAREILTGLARLGGRVVGIVANQSKHLGGVLFVNSADKAARFVNLCDAFGIPLIFLADVPGFMIGSKVEKEGIIRHGAKMIAAISEATVPRFCVVVRKAYGAGLYAMSGPGFDPDATLALPQAMIAVMGPEAAVNAVYFNKIQEQPEAEREAFVERLRQEYREDIDLMRLAGNLIVDAVVPPAALRRELLARLDLARTKRVHSYPKKRAVLPV
ncbi:MAG: acyl-CoA carboxylase subunit beta [Pseudomonadota bacterium]